MLATKNVTSNAQLVAAVDGALQAEGSVGTNTAGSPNFSDATTDAFADAAVGDKVFISGEAPTGGFFTIDTKTDDNNLVLDQNIATAHTATAHWRIRRGGIGVDNLLFDPIWD